MILVLASVQQIPLFETGVIGLSLGLENYSMAALVSHIQSRKELTLV